MKIENFGGIVPVSEIYKKQEINRKRKDIHEQRDKKKRKKIEERKNDYKDEEEDKGPLGNNIDIRL